MMYYLFATSLVFTLLCSLYLFRHFYNMMAMQSELINQILATIIPVKKDKDINQTNLTNFYREEE